MKHVPGASSLAVLFRRATYLLLPKLKIQVGSLFLYIILFQALHVTYSAKPSQYSGGNAESRTDPQKYSNYQANEIKDIVGYGEDCSPSDGIYCDEIQNLICDLSTESCVCDAENGFRHLSQILDNLENWELSIKGDCARLKTHKVNSKIINEDKVKKKTDAKVEEIDIVGYGEDCSSYEGPFCDSQQFLVCDPKDEICVCDNENGYIHINDVPGAEEQNFLLDGSVNIPKSLCVSKDHVAQRAQQLLLGQSRTDYENKIPSYNKPSGNMENQNAESIYKEILNRYAPEMENDPDKHDRLSNFKLQRQPLDGVFTGDELVVQELLKYSIMGTLNLVAWTSKLQELVRKSTPWKGNKLTDSICTAFFDLDKDKLATPREYAIALLSKKVKEVVMPKAFLDMIIPLPEENCITMEDLMEWKHDPVTLSSDFRSMDENGDNCMSFDEYRKVLEKVCVIDWLQIFLDAMGLGEFTEALDPSPEEIFVRRLMQNDKLEINFRAVDQDKDEFISFDELHNDLLFTESPLHEYDEGDEGDSNYERAMALFNYLDVDKDLKVSLLEVKLQQTIPSLTEEYQYAWLESLYELFETDDEEVQENLEIFENTYSKLIGKETASSQQKRTDQFFTIFDKNKNGEWDEVEFKLAMEIMTKFVVYGIINETVQLMDQDDNGRVSIFEFKEYFLNSSSTFTIYMKNLLAMEEEVYENMDENGNIENEDELEEEFDDDENDDDHREEKDGMVTISVSTKKLSKRAARANETFVIQKVFSRLDENKDNFLTAEDFYSVSTSYKSKMTIADLKEEFELMDVDKDGVITSKDSEDIVIPMDLKTFSSAYDTFSEDVTEKDYQTQFSLIDSNQDKIISKVEYVTNLRFIYDKSEEKQLLEWVETFLTTSPPKSTIDLAGDRIFRELDYNHDGFISQDEFKKTLDHIRTESSSFSPLNVPQIKSKTDYYFNNLDLNRDGRISYNEFHFLLLRTNKRINEF